MLENINDWLGHWEPVWLFLILFTETFVGFITAYILIIEFKYDKEWNDQLKQSKRDARKKKIEEQDISLCSGEHR